MITDTKPKKPKNQLNMYVSTGSNGIHTRGLLVTWARTFKRQGKYTSGSVISEKKPFIIPLLNALQTVPKRASRNYNSKNLFSANNRREVMSVRHHAFISDCMPAIPLPGINRFFRECRLSVSASIKMP